MVSKYLLCERLFNRRKHLNKPITVNNDASPSVNGVRMAGEERRLQILAVAMTLFSERGFRGTTTKEIAQAAGVSEAMVFRHFAHKEELYTAILDHKACSGGEFDPAQMMADSLARKDDSAVFEQFARGALQNHEGDPALQRRLLHA